jgi:hypothetical protein
VVLDPVEVDATKSRRVASNNSNAGHVYWCSSRVRVGSVWKEQEQILEHPEMG